MLKKDRLPLTVHQETFRHTDIQNGYKEIETERRKAEEQKQVGNVVPANKLLAYAATFGRWQYLTREGSSTVLKSVR